MQAAVSSCPRHKLVAAFGTLSTREHRIGNPLHTGYTHFPQLSLDLSHPSIQYYLPLVKLLPGRTPGKNNQPPSTGTPYPREGYRPIRRRMRRLLRKEPLGSTGVELVC